MASKSRLRDSGLLLSLLLALAVAGCGPGKAERIAELETETEIEDLRQQPAHSDPAATNPLVPATTEPTTPAPSATTAPSRSPSTSRVPTTGVEVLSVTDGDTLRMLVAGVNEPVRLIGINAPEGGECLATEAARRLGELVATGPVVLERDISERDQFDRLLRYVHAGEVFVNEALVREGLALAVWYQPDVARMDRLDAAQAAAETAGAGIWDPDVCGAATTANVEIEHIRYDAAGTDDDNLNDEWIELSNRGEGVLDLTGWSVKDESASHRYDFPSGFTLGPGATVRLHTGCGEDTTTSLYWCSRDSAVWNNSGDTVFVVDPSGNVVVSESY